MFSNNRSAQFIQSQGYTYFAFISYKHEDSKWAKWLKRKLQSYRLPPKTQERYRDLPARLSPIFRNYSVLLRNPQFLHKVEKRKRAEKNQRNVNIQEAKKVVC